MELSELKELLDKYPKIIEQFKKMLDIVESPNRGEFSTADSIEERTIDAVRGVGQEIIQQWAVSQATRSGERIQRQVATARKERKKKSTGTALLVK